MFWLLFRYVVFTVFVVLGVRFTVQRRHLELLCLYFWAVAFANCFVFIVTIWSPAKIVSLCMMWCVLFHKKERPPEHNTLYSTLFGLYVAVVVIGNLIALLTQFEVQVFKSSPIVRIILQDFSYLGAGILLFYGTLLKSGFAPRLFHSYAVAVEVSIIIAFIHLICNSAGFSFMPIMRAMEHNSSLQDASLSVKAMFGGEKVLRVYAFAGEPKNLGFLLVPYILMSIVCYVNGKVRRSPAYHIGMLVAAIFILIQTFSSSAIITFVLALPVLFLFVRHDLSQKTFMVMFAALLIAAPFIVSRAFKATEVALGVVDEKEFATALFERTFERGYNELNSGRQEVDIVNAYLDGGPLTLLFGWGIGQYTFHVEDSFTEDGALKTVQSGIVLSLADFGILGLLMYIFIGIVIFKSVSLSLKSPNTYEKMYSLAACSTYLSSFMYGSLFTSFILLMIAHYIRVVRKEKYGNSPRYYQPRRIKRRTFA